MSQLRDALIAEFQANANAEKAQQQQAYLKSSMPHYGLTAPVLRKLTMAKIREHPITDSATWRATALELWRKADHREERYAAIELIGFSRYRSWLDLVTLPLLEEMIVTGAWWDIVDPIATVFFGILLTNHPTQMRRTLRKWSRDDDPWRRRTAILAQLKFRGATDEKLLFDLILPSIDERYFFLRKAIGWALREYAKTAPDSVIEFVTEYSERLSPLSKREALRILIKGGRLDAIP